LVAANAELIAGSRRWRHLALAVLAVTLAVLTGGCGTVSGDSNSRPTAAVPVRSVASVWPSEADYQTIKVAVAVRDNALYHEPDWRRKSFGASLAMRTLMTVRLAPGRCAAYVTELYGSLESLMDAYRGEDWRPLVVLLRSQPPLSAACRGPKAGPAAPARAPYAL
jgi:hypothetical protein